MTSGSPHATSRSALTTATWPRKAREMFGSQLWLARQSARYSMLSPLAMWPKACRFVRGAADESGWSQISASARLWVATGRAQALVATVSLDHPERRYDTTVVSMNPTQGQLLLICALVLLFLSCVERDRSLDRSRALRSKKLR